MPIVHSYTTCMYDVCCINANKNLITLHGQEAVLSLIDLLKAVQRSSASESTAVFLGSVMWAQLGDQYHASGSSLQGWDTPKEPALSG